MTDRPPVRVVRMPAELAPALVMVDMAAGSIAVHPGQDHAGAVQAIRAVLPGVHPDAVDHWVEAVLPTAEPLWEVAAQRSW